MFDTNPSVGYSFSIYHYVPFEFEEEMIWEILESFERKNKTFLNFDKLPSRYCFAQLAISRISLLGNLGFTLFAHPL